MRDWLSRKEWNAEKRHRLEIEAAERAKAPGFKMSEKEWRELKFTGRIKRLDLVAVGDVASRQHKFIRKNGDPA